MGKGKGKLECWYTSIAGGVTLVEFKSLRKGRSAFFMKQLTHKFGIKTKYLFNTNTIYFSYPLKISKQTFFRTL